MTPIPAPVRGGLARDARWPLRSAPSARRTGTGAEESPIDATTRPAPGSDRLTTPVLRPASGGRRAPKVPRRRGDAPYSLPLRMDHALVPPARPPSHRGVPPPRLESALDRLGGPHITAGPDRGPAALELPTPRRCSPADVPRYFAAHVGDLRDGSRRAHRGTPSTSACSQVRGTAGPRRQDLLRDRRRALPQDLAAGRPHAPRKAPPRGRRRDRPPRLSRARLLPRDRLRGEGAVGSRHLVDPRRPRGVRLRRALAHDDRSLSRPHPPDRQGGAREERARDARDRARAGPQGRAARVPRRDGQGPALPSPDARAGALISYREICARGPSAPGGLRPVPTTGHRCARSRSTARRTPAPTTSRLPRTPRGGIFGRTRTRRRGRPRHGDAFLPRPSPVTTSRSAPPANGRPSRTARTRSSRRRGLGDYTERLADEMGAY